MTEDDINVVLARVHQEVNAQVKQALMSFNNDLKMTSDSFTAKTDELIRVIHGDGSKGAGLTVRLEKVEDRTGGIVKALWAVFMAVVVVIARSYGAV